MKKILQILLALFLFFNLSSCNAYNSGNIKTKTTQISNSTKMKLDVVLDKFFRKLDKKFQNNSKKIKVLKIINSRIKNLKEKKKFNTRLVLILDYVSEKILEKISKLQIILEGGAIFPEQYQNILGIGIDVNWANFPKEIKAYTNKWPQDFKKKGFANVRIRFREDVNLEHLKKVVDDSLEAGLVLVVAFGAGDFKNNPDLEHLEKAAEIWKKVAETLKNKDYKVSFDLVIEPGKNLKKKPQMLYKFYEKVVPMIRNMGGKNKNRIIFLAPNHLANPEYLQDLTSTFQKLNDKYLMAEFHFLAAGPFRKTNSTGKKITWNGTGSLEEKQKIEDRLKIAVNWQKQTGIKIWFGAWMPGNYNHTDDGGDNNYSIEEQVAFSTYFEGLLKKYQIPNDINADQKFYDIEKNTWRADRLKVVDSVIEIWKK